MRSGSVSGTGGRGERLRRALHGRDRALDVGIADVAVGDEAQPVGASASASTSCSSSRRSSAGASPCGARRTARSSRPSPRRPCSRAARRAPARAAARARGPSASRSTRWSSAKSAAAARIPTCRIPPAERLADPPRPADRVARADDHGAGGTAEPLREAEREQVDLLGVARDRTFEATLALKRRAPSRWTLSPRRSASARTACIVASRTTRPPA